MHDACGPPRCRPPTGAIEILKGAVESRTLEQIDLSQNRIGDDVPCWADATPCNRAMREVDMSFNWIQVGGEASCACIKLPLPPERMEIRAKRF